MAKAERQAINYHLGCQGTVGAAGSADPDRMGKEQRGGVRENFHNLRCLGQKNGCLREGVLGSRGSGFKSQFFKVRAFGPVN